MALAGEAERMGLDPQASVGSAEERLAGQYQGRQADTAVVSEIGGALAAGQTPASPAGTGQPVQGGPGKLAPRPAEEYAAAPEAKPVPGATPPPENPVSGNTEPRTGDPEARLGLRKTNPLTGKPIGFDPRDAAAPAAAGGGDDDFSGRVRELTGSGTGMTRGEAIDAANLERTAAGKPPLDRKASIEGMLGQDRLASAGRAKGNARRVDEARTAAAAAAETAAVDAAIADAKPFGSPAAPEPVAPGPRPPESAAFRFGNTLRQFTPPSVAGRVLAPTQRLMNPVASAVAGVTAGTKQAARGIRDSVAGVVSEGVLAGERRRRRTADLLRGIVTPSGR